LGLSQPTVSHHLRVLHEAGLLSRERRGQWVYYRIVAEQLSALRAALDVSPSPVPG
jgi:ArsR family transcriptional regulator, arsenate/arsenite/antimonite-responsive transcriptional repressor